MEATSLALLLFLKFDKIFEKEILNLVDFLRNNSVGGFFHSTQGTILALKALTEYVKTTKNLNKNYCLDVQVNSEIKKLETTNEEEIPELNFDIENEENKEIEIFVKNNENPENLKGKLKIEILYEYEKKIPLSSENSPLFFEINKKENSGSIFYKIRLENKENKNQGMKIIVF